MPQELTGGQVCEEGFVGVMPGATVCMARAIT